jgi:RND family efflux transporter MFP subunit
MNDVITEAAPAQSRTSIREAPGRDRRRRRAARLLAGGALTVLAALVGAGAWGHAEQSAARLTTLAAKRDAVGHVRTIVAKAVEGPRTIELPATLQAFDSATLYARATGYIAKRNVDIGSRVSKGDVLAVIAAPDLDQQLAQAKALLAQMRAALVQAQANADLARVTEGRTSRLVKDGWQSKQQGDTDRLNLAAQVAAVGVAQANLDAQAAQVSRLQQLTEFERVVAPFNGVITSRAIDVGSLVTADPTSGTPLFSIARTEVLRVQVYVPQEAVFSLHDGQQADVTVPELPGRVFRGPITRNASALEPGTRTMLTEVDLDNRDGALRAGLYGVVHIAVPRPHPVVIIPSEAVIFSRNGLQAAVVEDGRLRLRTLDIAADDGAQTEVRGGLKPGDRVIVSPPVDATDGVAVVAEG